MKDSWWCLLLICTFTCPSFALQSPTLSYQVHSYNDLREWPQILKKGATYFKVDPHYMNSSFCSTQSQVLGSVNNIDMGCFVLSHDQPVQERQYNSTYSILDFIANPAYEMYYKNPNMNIIIALCFKLDTASPCDGSDTATNWTMITDQFFETANAIVASKNLNVEFVLDGSSTPTDSNLCLIDKWRPWAATWIPGDSNDAPYSNNATLGLDRFQVFNPSEGVDPEYYIDIWKYQNYGKFSSGNYSYLIWEPSDQIPILQISDSYLTGPLHELGLRFAINIDPVQLEVFTGSRSGKAWNYELVPAQSTFSSLSLAVVVYPNSSSFYMITTYVDDTDNIPYYTISTAPEWNSTFMGSITISPPKKDPIPYSPFLSLHSLSGTSFLYASQMNGSYSILEFNETSLDMKEVARGSIAECLNCDSQPLFLGDLGEFVVLQMIEGSSSACSLQLQAYKLNNYTNISPLGSIQCIQSGNINITSYSFSIATLPDPFCGTGYLPGVVVYSDNNTQVYTSVLCFNYDTGAIILNGGSNGSGIVVDVGDEVSVSLSHNNGEVFVLEVHTDGFCWNSEPNNKQPTPATCNNSPVSVEYVMNYNFGSFSQWATHVMNIVYNKNQTYNLDSLFSSCHPSILHGAYDSGYSPQVSLFSAYDGIETVLVHAEIHLGLPSVFNSSSQCGFAVPTDGAIMLDSWNVNRWI